MNVMFFNHTQSYLGYVDALYYAKVFENRIFLFAHTLRDVL